MSETFRKRGAAPDAGPKQQQHSGAAAGQQQRGAGSSELHDAARTGDSAKIIELLAGSPDIDSRDKHSRTPLIMAAWAGQLVGTQLSSIQLLCRPSPPQPLAAVCALPGVPPLAASSQARDAPKQLPHLIHPAGGRQAAARQPGQPQGRRPGRRQRPPLCSPEEPRRHHEGTDQRRWDQTCSWHAPRWAPPPCATLCASSAARGRGPARPPCTAAAAPLQVSRSTPRRARASTPSTLRLRTVSPAGCSAGAACHGAGAAGHQGSRCSHSSAPEQWRRSGSTARSTRLHTRCALLIGLQSAGPGAAAAAPALP
jgi:hypothetical protein